MRHRILVVAKDVMLRSTLARWLTPAGYIVELAESGRRARVAAGPVLAVVDPKPHACRLLAERSTGSAAHAVGAMRDLAGSGGDLSLQFAGERQHPIHLASNEGLLCHPHRVLP
jgi:hypothetical protein